jgi:hypothetical protein
LASVLLGVIRLDAEQHKNAAADLANKLTADSHAGPTDSL